MQEIMLGKSKLHLLPEENNFETLITNLYNEKLSENINRNRIRKFISSAIKDDTILFFIDVPEDYDVWEYRHEAEDHYFNHIGWHMAVEYSVGNKLEGLVRLMLDERALMELFNSENDIEANVYSFPAGVCFSEKTGEEWISSPSRQGWKYYLFTKGKTDNHFYSENESENIAFLSIGIKDLIVCIDISIIKDLDMLIKDFPEFCVLPPSVQDKLQSLPSSYENYSPRLGYLTDAYKQFWLEENPWDDLDDSQVISIHKQVESYILERLKNEEIKSGPYLGISFAKTAALFVLPDEFIFDEKLKNIQRTRILVSDHVPQKLWVIHCLSDLMLKNVKPEEICDKNTVSAFIKILMAMNRPRKIDLLDKFSSFILDLFYFNHPEVKYFRALEFSKDEAECAAKICMPKSLF